MPKKTVQRRKSKFPRKQAAWRDVARKEGVTASDIKKDRHTDDLWRWDIKVPR